MTKLLILFTFLLAFCLTAQAQATLTNDDVIKLVKLGLSAKVIAAKIKSTPGKYDTSIDALTTLKAANVPDEILLAMIEAGADKTATEPVTASDVIASAEQGDLGELRNKFNVFILTDNLTSRDLVANEIAKYPGLHIVGAEREADFLIAFGNISQITGTSVSGGIYSAQARTDYRLFGEMAVVTRTTDKAHPVRIHWHTTKIQDVTNGWTLNRAPEVNATRELIKAFKEMRGEGKGKSQFSSFSTDAPAPNQPKPTPTPVPKICFENGHKILCP